MRYPRAVRTGFAVAMALVLAATACTRQQENGSSSNEDDTITVAFVPKLQGIPYFEAMNTGGQQAAEDLGVEWIYRGATTADPGAQTEIVRSLIQQRVDVLVPELDGRLAVELVSPAREVE